MSKYIECKIPEVKVGDIIRHKSGSTTFIVVANFGDRITAVSVADITNEIEWLHLPNPNRVC